MNTTRQDQEEWRWLLNRHGEVSGYEVSSLGRVRSQHPGHEGKILKGGEGFGSDVYKRRSVWLTDVWHPQSKLYYVERLVAETYLDAPKDGEKLVWINGRKWDNRAVNLTWRSARATVGVEPVQRPQETLAELEANVQAAWELVRKATEDAIRATKTLGLAQGREEAQKGVQGSVE